MKTEKFISCVAGLFFLVSGIMPVNAKNVHWNNTAGCSAYLFTYFTGNGRGEEAIRFAVSEDGYHFRALNGNRPVLDVEKISSTGGVRDPHILRGQDGKTFYMVATDMQVARNGWGPNHAMVMMKSEDLVHWNTTVVNIPDTYSEFKSVNRVWAPQTIYDPKVKKYMLYWSMRFGEGSDVIYYAYANKDFTALESVPRILFQSPTGGSCIDGDIIPYNGKYHLFFKTEGAGNGIKKAVSESVTGPYVLHDEYLQQTKSPVEGSGVFKLIGSDAYILMYDMYTSGKYQFTRSTDLLRFEVIDQDVTMDFNPRHGTVMPVTRKELQRLVTEWGRPEDMLPVSSGCPDVKKKNLVVDKNVRSVYMPVRSGVDLQSFDPGFVHFPGTVISPAGKQDFTKGPVTYRVVTDKMPQMEFSVTAAKDGNPVLEGYYADPEILYSHKTGRFYLYPTSDGFTGWSGNYFKVFSSPDLANWTDEGVILNLPSDVSWADRNAWAPCILEKESGGSFRYFYYFTAAQKIGVAVSDDPLGPFTDSGRSLVSAFPDGVKSGQQIDPDVFSDPVSGKDYLYWGNGYLAVAELGADMVSLKSGTIRVITPSDGTFREGAYVFYRNGVYYFMWSEDDTRSANYRVRYGTSDSPFGPIHIPADNLVLAKDERTGIYGTGHNSVIQIPGRDEWYIVYHRFTRPDGIGMGESAGFHREVCIDRLEFNEDNSIRPVRPTLAGIDPVSMP